MAIHEWIEGGTFGPEQIAVLSDAFDRSIAALHITDRKGADALAVAAAVVDAAERDMQDAGSIASTVVVVMTEARQKLAGAGA